jgi:hypothetical protein
VSAACGGLTGFAVALIAGLAADNPAETVLFRSLMAMFVCQLICGIVGAVGERVMREAIRDFQDSHPVNKPSTTPPLPAVETPGVAATSA